MASDDSPDSVIEEVNEKIAKALETWKAVGATPVPKTLKEARQNKWELASDAVEVGFLLAYPHAEQEGDARRAIRLEKAIAIVDAFETELVSQLVVRPENFIAKIKSTIESAGTIAFRTVQTVWRYGGSRALWLIVRTLVEHIFVTVGAGILIAAIVRAVKTRKSIEAEMKKNALPQRSARRYVRRKVTRR